MKKYLILPAIIGLVAVPSLAMAQNGADDVKTSVSATHQSSNITRPAFVDTQSTSTGTSGSQSSNSSDDAPKAPVTVPDGSITVDAAKAIAQAAFPDKTITKTETELEHGVVVYEFKFSDGSEVKVLASDGTIVSSESESNESDNRSAMGTEHAQDSEHRNTGRGSDNSGRSGHDD